MYLDFVIKVDLQVHKTRVIIQKIDSSKLNAFDKVIAFFSMEDKERRFYNFEKTSLFADISINVMLKMPFFTLNNVKIDFIGCHIY